MLYIAIPAHNEAATIGVLLWRLRTVLAEFPREYEVVVYDDASTDSTPEVLAPYSRILPLTVLRGETSIGYAGAIDALVRHVTRQTRYPRRDAILLLQGDFTDPPALIPEFARRFEGGADIVVGERSRSAAMSAPRPVRRLLRATPWLLRPFVGVEGVHDLTSCYRLIRISVLRDLLRSVGETPVCAGDVPGASADFLLRAVPLARRVETIAMEPTWSVRLRESRRVAVRDGLALARWAWRSRGRRAVPSTAPEIIEAPRVDSRTDGRPARRDGKPDTRREPRRDAKPELKREPQLVSRRDESRRDESPVGAASRDPRKRSKRRKRGRDGATLELHLTDVDTVRGHTRVDIANEPQSEPEIALREDGADHEVISLPLDRGPRRTRKKRRQRGSRAPREEGAEPINGGASDGGTGSDRADVDRADPGHEPEAPASSGISLVPDEARLRKRGRRGRRGGSRRNRGARDGDAQSNDSPTPSAEMPAPPSSPPSPE